MRVEPVLAVAFIATVVAGCTGTPDEPPSTTPTSSSSTSAPAPTTPEPSPTGSPSPTASEVAFGTGVVRVDGTQMPVSGDCDISREFGTRPVAGLDEDVEVLLVVDNVTGDGDHGGPFALQVRLLGDGPVTERRVASQGADGDADATYEGPVTVAELRDRRELEFLDVATLHVEATQDRVGGEAGPPTRELVLDVTCAVSRPG